MNQIANTFACAFLILLPLLNGCSGDAAKPAAVVKEEPAVSNEKPAAGSGDCCFKQESDFEKFIPKGNEMITPFGKGSSNFFCNADDDPKRTTFNVKYQIDKMQYKDPKNYKYISLRIEDYCANPKVMLDKHARMRKTSEDYAAKNPNVKMENLKMDGVYEGYAVVDATKGNNSQNVMINVIVDNRIRIDITGIDHTRLDIAKQLLELIPVKELAAFGK